MKMNITIHLDCLTITRLMIIYKMVKIIETLNWILLCHFYTVSVCVWALVYCLFMFISYVNVSKKKRKKTSNWKIPKKSHKYIKFNTIFFNRQFIYNSHQHRHQHHHNHYHHHRKRILNLATEFFFHSKSTQKNTLTVQTVCVLCVCVEIKIIITIIIIIWFWIENNRNNDKK